MSFVTKLVIDELIVHLTDRMITQPRDLDPTDPSIVNVIKFGRFLENPTAPGKQIYLSISGGSQTDPDLRDQIVDSTENRQVSMYVPAYEIGGGEMWWRRGEVKVGFFLGSLKLSEDACGDLAYEIFGRLMANIENCPVGGIVDSNGETVLLILCFASTFMESGGGGNFIWRGSVKWQILTERPPRR